MKKLMIAAAIVCAAAVAQAAGVRWTTSALYNPDGSTVLGNAKAYVYLLADETAYNNLTDVWGTYKSDILDNAGGGASGTGTSQSWSSTISVVKPGSTDAAKNTKYYAAIITTYGTGDDMVYIAEKLSATTGEDSSATVMFARAAETSAGAKTAWKSAAAAPEPTSGLLLLLGVAGLALKRRRA